MKTALSILFSGAFIALIVFVLNTPQVESKDNVRMENGTQIITINAKGSYSPQASIAKAQIPTKLRMKTSGTYDCSAALRIPAYNIDTILPPTDTTEFDLGLPRPGTVAGGCSMGMYAFEIQFE